MGIEIATELEQRVVDSINSERTAEGLSELKIEAHLNDSAQAHSEWMGDTGTFSHEGEDGSTPTDRIEDAGFPLTGDWQTAENIAYVSVSGRLDAGEVDRMHEGLMESAGHRANILDPDAAYVGVGLSIGNINVHGVDQEVVFLTEHFADTGGEVLVQEEIGGETFLKAYIEGEPIGDPQVPVTAPEDPDNPDEDDEEEEEEEENATAGGACFVATAVYGNPSHPDVVDLRRFRDEVLVKHRAGRVFIRAYWVVGPKLAGLVSADGTSGRAARVLISPLARMARERADRRR